MLYPSFRPTVPAVHSRTFWFGAFTLLMLSALVAWHHRDSDVEGILMRRYLLHALLGAALLAAFGVVYARHPSIGISKEEGSFEGSAHFWLSFSGIFAMMMNEFLIPESVLGWDHESMSSPGYYFLHVSTQGLLRPIGLLVFALGQGYFLFRLGMVYQDREERQRLQG
ncbi:MAG: hypothetical protein NWR72_04280 [Bacteroidia bacterium]|nr:hypothetical protein [Bacteroidia bacterium]